MHESMPMNRLRVKHGAHASIVGPWFYIPTVRFCHIFAQHRPGQNMSPIQYTDTNTMSGSGMCEHDWLLIFWWLFCVAGFALPIFFIFFRCSQELCVKTPYWPTQHTRAPYHHQRHIRSPYSLYTTPTLICDSTHRHG